MYCNVCNKNLKSQETYEGNNGKTCCGYCGAQLISIEPIKEENKLLQEAV